VELNGRSALGKSEEQANSEPCVTPKAQETVIACVVNTRGSGAGKVINYNSHASKQVIQVSIKAFFKAGLGAGRGLFKVITGRGAIREKYCIYIFFLNSYELFTPI
jgi:hypothetical protein